MGTTTTRFAVDGWNSNMAAPLGLENFNDWAVLTFMNALQTRNLFGNQVDQVFGRVDQTGASDPNGTYWDLTDHLGSVRDVINNSGVAKDSISFDAYGNLNTGTETSSTYRGMYARTGRELDVETGLQYNRARWYDPNTGRWGTQDPMGFDAGDNNLYRYVRDNPSTLNDPSGAWPYYNLGFMQPIQKAIISFSKDGGKDAGGYYWPLSWQLDTPTPLGGFIIQEVQKDIYNKYQGVLKWKTQLHYWEAWPVEPGQSTTIYQSDATEHTALVNDRKPMLNQLLFAFQGTYSGAERRSAMYKLIKNTRADSGAMDSIAGADDTYLSPSDPTGNAWGGRRLGTAFFVENPLPFCGVVGIAAATGTKIDWNGILEKGVPGFKPGAAGTEPGILPALPYSAANLANLQKWLKTMGKQSNKVAHNLTLTWGYGRDPVLRTDPAP